MRKPKPTVPDKTLETLARNFCREAEKYGFTQIDYLRYVNHLLEYAAEEKVAGAETPTAMGTGGDGPKSAESVMALPVSGERVRLRSFDRERDIETFRRWVADDYGRYFLLSRISGRRADIDAILENPAHIIGVVELQSGKPIGSVAYLNYDSVRRKAELRKLIGDADHRGTGLAREATALWIRYGLEALELKKIYVNTLHTHFRNIKLNESLGFRVEGLLHNEAVIDGEYHDVLRMGLWRTD